MAKLSEKVKPLKQSGIRAASQRCASIKGINLGQGICDLPADPSIKQAAYAAIDANKNTYSACEGIFPLRQALAEKLASFNRIECDPRDQIIVSHGSTGAFVAAVMAAFNPGDEIILFEPFYGYHKGLLELNGLTVKAVSIDVESFAIDWQQLQQVLGAKTRGMVICTPCNPIGKVFSEQELTKLGEIAIEHDLTVITDEIYEYITYPGHEHISMASLPGLADRVVTISGFSKTYNMTGWRLGYASGPAELIKKMALVQDLLYICPATPLQHAALAALSLPPAYYQTMQQQYLHKRDQVLSALRQLGLPVATPQGAYYLLANVSSLGFNDDEHAAEFFLNEAKVAVVPGRAFYNDPTHGQHIVRICYALDEPVVMQAMQQLQHALEQSGA